MAAHLRTLRRCGHERGFGQCGKPATQELYNAVNAPSGVYCDAHADKALEEWLEASEQRAAGFQEALRARQQEAGG